MIYSIKVRTQADYGLGRKALFGAGLGAFYGGLGGSIYDKQRAPKESESWLSRNRGAVIGAIGGAGAGYLLGNKYDKQTPPSTTTTVVKKEETIVPVIKQNEVTPSVVTKVTKTTINPVDGNIFGNAVSGLNNDLDKIKPKFDSNAKESASNLLDLAEQYKSIDYNGGSKLKRSREKVLNAIKAFRKQQKLHPEKTYSKNNIVDALNSYRRIQDKAINDGNVGTEQVLNTLNALREKYKFKSNFVPVVKSRYI